MVAKSGRTLPETQLARKCNYYKREQELTDTGRDTSTDNRVSSTAERFSSTMVYFAHGRKITK
jgi:hypothetical protein